MNLVALAEIADVQSGAGFPLEYQGQTTGDYPFAKVGDISEAKRREGSTISSSNHYVSAEVARKLRAKIFPADTTVFAKIGEAIRGNRKVITTRPMIFDNNVMGILPDSRKVVPRYLFHYLDHIDFYPLANSTTVPSIRKSDMETVQVWLPELDKQRQLAAILDQADILRRKRQRVLDRLDHLGQTIFNEIFPECRKERSTSLGDLCLDVKNWNPKNRGADETFTYVDISTIDQDKKRLVSTKRLLVGEAPSRAKQLIREGDVLVSTVRPNLNSVALVPQELDGAIASTGFCVLRPNTSVATSEFIFSIVISREFIAEMVESATGASYPAVSDKIVKSYCVSPPDGERLKRLGERKLIVNSLTECALLAYSAADQSFRALQSRAFKGEL